MERREEEEEDDEMLFGARNGGDGGNEAGGIVGQPWWVAGCLSRAGLGAWWVGLVGTSNHLPNR